MSYRHSHSSGRTSMHASGHHHTSAHSTGRTADPRRTHSNRPEHGHETHRAHGRTSHSDARHHRALTPNEGHGSSRHHRYESPRPRTAPHRHDAPRTSSSARSVCSSVGGVSQWCQGAGYSGGPSVVSAAGMDNRTTKTNQDSSFVFQRKSGGDDFICGVIDGHGAQGHHVSDFIRRNLAPQIIQERKQHAQLGTRAAIAQGFVNTATKLRQKREIDATESGAVVAMCMRKGQDVYVANVGDTRAVLASEEGGRVRGKALTQDHTPALPGEKERIYARGGEVAPAMYPGVGHAGPPRVWQRGQVAGGLCVTRAIGDTSLNNVGVTAEPEVTKHRIRSSDRYVVIASDGCWDHVSNDRAAKLAMQHKDPRQASEAIVQEARQAWKRSAQNTGYIDDITCLVVPVQ